ncbi:MAG: hypothetical protein ACRD4X_13595 [Candidatus Acidiferrales bacterium]
MKHAVKLDPALKSWLDNVIMPALLREYLQQLRAEDRKELAMDSRAGVVSLSGITESKGATE